MFKRFGLLAVALVTILASASVYAVQKDAKQPQGKPATAKPAQKTAAKPAAKPAPKKAPAATTSKPKPTNTKKVSTLPDTLVKISTVYGDILIKLYDNTPLHKANFIKLAQDSFYDGTIFHRVIRSFMIQGGDPDSRNPKPGAQYGMGGPNYTVPAEFNKENIHKKGALAAARMGDQMNPQRASSGSQFYIVQGQVMTREYLQQMSRQTGVTYTEEQIQTYCTIGGTPFLDMQYTVFGEVVEGLDVVDKIANAPTQPGDRPVTDVVMKVTLEVGKH